MIVKEQILFLTRWISWIFVQALVNLWPRPLPSALAKYLPNLYDPLWPGVHSIFSTLRFIIDGEKIDKEVIKRYSKRRYLFPFFLLIVLDKQCCYCRKVQVHSINKKSMKHSLQWCPAIQILAMSEVLFVRSASPRLCHHLAKHLLAYGQSRLAGKQLYFCFFVHHNLRKVKAENRKLRVMCSRNLYFRIVSMLFTILFI